MRRGHGKTWAVFFLLVLLVGLALGWVSERLLRSEAVRVEGEQRERLHADLRLAVWRIDSLLAPVLAWEAARPPSQYQSFYPLTRSYDAKGQENAGASVLVPSPLLNPTNEWATLNFEVDQAGNWSSPQVPANRFIRNAGANGVPLEQMKLQKVKLDGLSEVVDYARLDRELDLALAEARSAGPGPWFVFHDVSPPAAGKTPQTDRTAQVKQAVGNYNARSRAVQRMASNVMDQNNTLAPASVAVQARVSRLIPLWLPDRNREPGLVLARKIQKGGNEYIQGVLVDWLRLKAMAKEEMKDLLPRAELRPRRGGDPLDPDRILAVLPAEIDPGPAKAQDPTTFSPVRVGLGLIWMAFLLGALFIGAGLRSLLRLNRRRLDFVSAVTHELRTPLTTFNLYTEMLRDGMVPPGKEGEYFSSLHEESLRLSHLVQNVLDFSRLESGHGVSRVDKAPLSQHLEKILPPLRGRCERRDVRLDVVERAPLDSSVELDTAAVGQILYNLVDNACKYGVGDVSLAVARRGSSLLFEVSNQGPGIDRREEGRIFTPFYRGRSSEGRGPGVGLGLALCRRWAREMGGDLRLEEAGETVFVLEVGSAALPEGP